MPGNLTEGFTAASIKVPLAQEVAAKLRNAIATGVLAPGEWLQETSLAETMGVSRGPLREALVQLEREGLVIKHNNRGTFVARLTARDLDEVYSLRLALEQLAVQRAAQAGERRHLDVMQGVVDQLRVSLGQPLTEPLATELDLEYHEHLCLASGHRRLHEAWVNLRPQIQIFLLGRDIASMDFSMLVNDHQAILDAINRHDTNAATARIEAHIRLSFERVVQAYRGHSNSTE
jgi:DNA-binding GntR family transcriptional regulator